MNNKNKNDDRYSGRMSYFRMEALSEQKFHLSLGNHCIIMICIH